MKKLAKNIKENRDFQLTQVWRDKKLAIYRQVGTFPEGKVENFEVIKILFREPGDFGGDSQLEEVYPNPRDWGVKGFTVKTLEQAKLKVKKWGGKCD
jgi:hypothetical protein